MVFIKVNQKIDILRRTTVLSDREDMSVNNEESKLKPLVYNPNKI